jgi:GNAT superfamily N-acetyltransferase
MPERPIRTWLEMRDRTSLRPARLEDGAARIEQVRNCPPSFWRYLYTEVGRAYRWIDRLPWTDDDIRAYLGDPAVTLWLLTVSGAPAGYFELRQDGQGGVEIAYFGLLPEFVGHGLGGHLLTEAVETAWNGGARRVWLHTNTMDHPAALPNYSRRGFTVFRTEEFEP